MSLRILLFISLYLLLFIANGRQIPPERKLADENGVVLDSTSNATTASSSSSSCPLNFTVLTTLTKGANVKPSNDVGLNCQYILEGLRLVLSQYLLSTGNFHPPLDSAESCWNSYESVVDSFLPGFKILSTCGFQPNWISESCMNISTRAEFERVVGVSSLNDVVASCNQSLLNPSPCASCLTSLTTLQASKLGGNSTSAAGGGISDCTNLPLIYAGAFVNPFGPADIGTSKCLFSVNLSTLNGGNKRKKLLIVVILVVGFVGIFSVVVGYLVYSRLKQKRERELKKRRRSRMTQVGSGSGSGLGSIGGSSTHLVKFSFDDIKLATRNFHRDNLIGRGGYGNVYKGTLVDGTEVAIKRFKNCSAAGDAGFTHEVEVIASIRHVNLVELRGYCVATTRLEGHQRIIVCDLMKNGSLHDHLFAGDDVNVEKLSWPIRQKIALGMARGLAYLHYGAQPAVIHRDIKASNIMLDENFDAKVGDFGLAKFNPEGFTHLSTRVAGTMGYVAPEYALYGQLTERSDVYSFGVVLLELLSGKKAIMSMNEGTPSLVTDWAWSLVRKGHPLDVIEEGMAQLGPDSVMEKYVLVAVLCSHPQMYARPTMDQVVKILETDLPVPSIPERPIPLISELGDIERSASSSGSGHLSTPRGFQSYTMGNFDSSSTSHNGQEEPLKLEHNEHDMIYLGQ